MRNAGFYLFAAAILLITSCKRETGFEEGTFTVLTYNVAGLPEGLNADQFPTKYMHQISPLLNGYDIVNVQEDFHYHNVLIKDVLQPYKTITKGTVPFGDGLNMFSNFPFYGLDRHKWNLCSDVNCLTPKGFSYCQIKISNKVFIDMYNVHCNAGSDTAGLIARRNNIIQLCTYIEQHSIGNAVLIMGDMNSRYSRLGDNIREVINRGFKDVWVERAQDGIYPLQNGNSLMDCGSDFTRPTCETVDKIFYRSSDFIQLTPVEFEMQELKFTDSTGTWLSDHRPLYAKFKYEATYYK